MDLCSTRIRSVGWPKEAADQAPSELVKTAHLLLG